MNQSDTGTPVPPHSNTGGKDGKENPAKESIGDENAPDGYTFVREKRQFNTDRSRLNLSITPEIAGLLDEAAKALGLKASQIALSVLLQGMPSIRAQIDAVRPKRGS